MKLVFSKSAKRESDRRCSEYILAEKICICTKNFALIMINSLHSYFFQPARSFPHLWRHFGSLHTFSTAADSPQKTPTRLIIEKLKGNRQRQKIYHIRRLLFYNLNEIFSCLHADFARIFGLNPARRRPEMIAPRYTLKNSAAYYTSILNLLLLFFPISSPCVENVKN